MSSLFTLSWRGLVSGSPLLGADADANGNRDASAGAVEAWTFCAILAVSFVAALYVLVPSRVRNLRHNDPAQILARFRATGASSVASGALLWYWFGDRMASSPLEILPWMGFRLGRIVTASMRALLLAGFLFAGPLAVAAAEERARSSLTRRPFSFWALLPNARCFAGLEFWRNIWVAPFVEELVFRSCFAGPLVLARMSPWVICWASPLLFGFAHLHHAIGRMRSGTPPHMAMLAAVFQCAYTTLFGAFEMFVLLRTGHYVAIALVHSFCNSMGLPNLSFLTFDRHPLRERRFVFAAIYLAGIAAFAAFLVPLTDPAYFESVLWRHLSTPEII